MINGILRIFVPAVAVWVISAICIGFSGLAISIFWLILTFIAVVILLIIVVRLFTKANFFNNFLKLLRITLITIAFLLLVLARIASIEQSAASAASHLGIEQAGSLNINVTVSDFASSTSGFGDDRFAVRANYSSEGGSLSLILWIEGIEARSWSPGTKLSILGMAEKQPAAAGTDFAVSVNKYRTHDDRESLVTKLRLSLQDAASKHNGATLVPGFAVGDTDLVTSDLELKMLESSLTHLTAVSGANCALVTGAIFLISGYLGAKRKTRITIAAVSLLGFVTVVGPDASVQRAALMAAVTLISGFGGKKSIALPALGTAMLILLLLDPWQARAPGFTLSVAATFGILVFVPTLSKMLSKILRLPAVLLLPITVTLAAQFACSPLLLLMQPGIPAAGIPANVLAAPAAPIGTASGLIALVLLPINQEIGNFWVWIGSFASRWVEAVASVSIELPLARWYWPGGAQGAILLFVIQISLIVAVIVWHQNKKPRKPWSVKPKQSVYLNVLVTGLFALSGAMFISITTVTPFAWRLAAPKDWIMVACDVGQGDATIVRNPSIPNQIMLIDTGNDEQLLLDCLHLFGVTQINLLVLTHDDSDHVAALPAVIEKVDAALINPTIWGKNEHEREVIKQLNSAGVPFTIATSGMNGYLDRNDSESVSWQVLWPNQGALPIDDNSGSIVMRITVQDNAFLILGDTGKKEHRELLANQQLLDVDVIKIAHHGSGDQDPKIIDASGANYGVISSGFENRYGHPHPDVLFAMNMYGVKPLRTDQNGTIALTFNKSKQELDIWAQK